MKPTLIIGSANIYQGNNLDILPELQSNSVDSIVCDPPYELGFMGKSWDSSGIAYSVELWTQCLRVLKPGGHLLAFGGTRTWHRLAVAIEDAGFEIRDNIAWLYGSGFPKSHNISKAIDKAAGAERQVIGIDKVRGNSPSMWGKSDPNNPNYDGTTYGIGTTYLTESATTDAKQWDGWGTALKPAHEPIVVARKPVIGTVADNVLKYGTGAINIDATRIGTETISVHNAPQGSFAGGEPERGSDTESYREHVGRWPANIILDEHTAQLLDEQSDASRFFYVAKASKRDRNEGLDELPMKQFGTYAQDDWSRNNMGKTPDAIRTPVANFHPTVKPTALMQYLIRLVTPEGGVVLDPFAGSGSTGKAAILEGKRFIGIELTAEYLPIIEGRLKHAYLTLDDKEDDLFE